MGKMTAAAMPMLPRDTMPFRVALKNTFLAVLDDDDEWQVQTARRRAASVGSFPRHSTFVSESNEGDWVQSSRSWPGSFNNSFAARDSFDLEPQRQECVEDSNNAATKPTRGRSFMERAIQQEVRAYQLEEQVCTADCQAAQVAEGTADDLDEPESSTCDSISEGPQTTVMLKGVPRHYTRDMVAELLNEHGFYQKYDFLYLPLQFVTKVNFGYAFVNLVSAEDVDCFWKHFQGAQPWGAEGTEADVSWSSIRGGLAAHVDHLRNSPIMHQSMLDEYKPVVLVSGVRAKFPEPTRELKPPRTRRSRLSKSRAAHLHL